jgi:phage gp46-like protein
MTYQWFINGVLFAVSAALSYAPTKGGLVAVKLVLNDGLETAEHTHYYWIFEPNRLDFGDGYGACNDSNVFSHDYRFAGEFVASLFYNCELIAIQSIQISSNFEPLEPYPKYFRIIDYRIAASSGTFNQNINRPVFDLRNNVIFSLRTMRGSCIWNKNFGMRSIPKMTLNAVLLAREYAKEALQWLLFSRRAQSIEIESELDPVASDRINLRIYVDGELFNYQVRL